MHPLHFFVFIKTAIGALNLKQKDYICFKESMLMIKSKKHLTQEGLDKIKAFNLEMNSILALD